MKGAAVIKMNVAYFLTPKCETAFLYEDYSLRQGLEKLKYHGFSALPVIDREGHYVGTISEGDFLWYLVKGEYRDVEQIDVRGLEYTKIKDVTEIQKYPSVSATAKVEELFELALQQNFVPIVDDRGLFMGIVTRQRIINYFYSKAGFIGQEAYENPQTVKTA